MIVVADTSPILYLVLIDQANLLQALYGKVIVPDAVAAELLTPASPTPVRSWISNPPESIQVRSATPEQLEAVSAELDLGERMAIALAMAFSADLLLIDDARGRIEARRRHLVVTGTLGVLRTAAEQGLIDVAKTLDRLRATNFYASEALIKQIFGPWTHCSTGGPPIWRLTISRIRAAFFDPMPRTTRARQGRACASTARLSPACDPIARRRRHL